MNIYIKMVICQSIPKQVPAQTKIYFLLTAYVQMSCTDVMAV